VQAEEWIRATLAFSTDAHRAAARLLCVNGRAIVAMYRNAKNDETHPTDSERIDCPPNMTRDQFTALLSTEVKGLWQRQAH